MDTSEISIGITVILPQALRAQAGNRKTVTASGRTVRDVIAALERDYPGMKFHLCYETGELRPFVNLFLNGKHIRYLQGLETPVADGATVHILPSVAGG